MLSANKNDQDRRVKRTKSLVFAAFYELVQSSRYDELKTVQIIEKAGIGKSTFYEHFLDKDDVLSQSLEYPMSIFAGTLTGDTENDNISFMLGHFWDRRVFARIILQHPTREIVDNCLRKLIIGELNDTAAVSELDTIANASFLSSGFLSLLHDWLIGRLNMSVNEMAACVSKFSIESTDD